MKLDFLARCVIVGVVVGGASCVRAASLVLTKPQREKLVRIVHENPTAGALFERIRRDADAALGDRPNPIAVIQTEGKLQSDPVKKRTWESLGDMPKVEALGWAYAVSGERKYAEKIREFVLAWAKVNHSAGDPIDDTNYEPMLVAYDLTRDTFRPKEREMADAWLHGIADEEVRTGSTNRHTTVNNWNSHRIKIVGMIAFALEDKSMIEGVVRAYKKQIGQNLLPDGSSIDFHERDALHYQVYDLEPLLTLCIAARNNGIDLYHYEAANGASLPKGVAFILPFVEGTQQHAEFVHSTVDFDRKRAASGQAEYRAGNVWNPHAGLNTLALDEAFDPSVLPLVGKLEGKEGERYPDWRVVLNEAEREGKSE